MNTIYKILATMLVLTSFTPIALADKIPTRLKTLPQEHVLLNNEKLYPKLEKFDTYIQTSGPIISKNPFSVPNKVPEKMPKIWNIPFNSHNYFTQKYHKDSNKPYSHCWYVAKYTIKDQKDLDEKSYVLKFKGVTHKAAIFVNNKKVSDTNISFVPFDVDISKELTVGENLIHIYIRSDIAKFSPKKNYAMQPYGAAWWKGMLTAGLTYGVDIYSYPKNYPLFDLTISPSVSQGKLVITFPKFKNANEIKNATLRIKNADASTKNNSAVIVQKLTPQQLLNGSVTVNVENKLKLWDVNSPNLYDATLSFSSPESNSPIAFSQRFGYREFIVKNGDFYFNGKKFYVFGQNTTTYDWLPCRYTERKERAKQAADMEKQILGYLSSGYNIVRTAHEPIPDEYLTIADECGLPIMNEWAWAFIYRINDKEFSDNAKQSLPSWVKHSGAHPSVVSWVLSNEVMLEGKANAQKQMEENYKLVKNADLQNRPINLQSGGAGWYGGNFAYSTEVLDFHNYASISENWTHFRDIINNYIDNNVKKYGKERFDRMPLIAMETVGISWGLPEYGKDVYIPNDREEYGKYFSRQISWGSPNVTGFLGAFPLEFVLSKDFTWEARRRYGKRIYETIRCDERMNGFAPWFPAENKFESWNKPVLPILLTKYNLFPNNIWANETINLKAIVHNTTGYRTDKSILSIGSNSQKMNISGTKPFDITQNYINFIFKSPIEGKQKLSVTLDGKYSNSYDVNVFKKSSIFTSLKNNNNRQIYILDIGKAKEFNDKVLSRFELSGTIINSYKHAKKGSLLIIPPNDDVSSSFNADDPDFKEFANYHENSIIILEQTAPSTILPCGLNLQIFPSTFIDITDRTHPIFVGLDRSIFDTWNTPDKGYVTKTYIAPYNAMNTLLAKGPMLSSTTRFGSALVEGRINDKAYLLISTLDAVANIDNDPGAAIYIRRILENTIKKDYKHTLYVLQEEAPIFSGDINNLSPISLDSYVNASSKEWTDQGDTNLASLKSGKKTYSGIVFTLPQSKQDKNQAGIIRLLGHDRPQYPSSVNIKVNANYKSMHFLHTAAWCSKAIVGGYRINHANGKKTLIKLEANNHVADWRNARNPQSAKKITIGYGDDKSNGDAFIYSWKNPYPEVEISSIDILSADGVRNGQNAWEATYDPVLIVLAITGEK